MQKYQEFQEKIDFEYPLNAEDEAKIANIQCFKQSVIKTFFYYIFGIITGGIFFLVCHWSFTVKIGITLTPCDNIQDANRYLITSIDQQQSLIKGKKRKLKINEEEKEYQTFEYRLFTYYFNQNSNKFCVIQFNLSSNTTKQIHENFGQGISSQDKLQQQIDLFGLNETTIPEQSTLQVFILEILTPFYIFQACSVILWMWDDYRLYATVILVTSAISIIITVYETKKNMKKLREMSYYEINVQVYRNLGNEQLQQLSNKNQLQMKQNIFEKPNFRQHAITLKSNQLVPGDLIEIPEGLNLPCDVVLLNGTAITNEAMLTGEAIPVIKTALPYDDSKYDFQSDHKSSTLFSGTNCIETRYFDKENFPILGLVSETGFNTMKGTLLRSIMYPKEQSFQFYKDSIKFIGVMGMVAACGFSYSLVSLIRMHDDISDIIDKCLDIITVTVPPALPTAMSVGISFAISRLTKKSIFCIAPSKINVCGRVNLMCFDKTGTLTEDCLDLLGIQTITQMKTKNSMVENSQQQNSKSLSVLKVSQIHKKKKYKFGRLIQLDEIENISSMNNSETQKVQNQHYFQNQQQLIQIMATCHSLSMVKEKLIGDPLDVKMFESTKWIIDDSNLSKHDQLILATVQPPNKQVNKINSQLHQIEEILEDEGLADQQQLQSNSILTNPSFKIKNDFNQMSSQLRQSIISQENMELNSLKEISIIKRYEFSAKLQRMSVIVSNINDKGQQQFTLFAKGSPEKVRELCLIESIPKDFHIFLNIYAKNGFRVLACAKRNLNASYRKIVKYDRQQVEKNLIFVGFLIFQNRLKPITKSIIDTLKQARVRTIMVTGDNALTAISVARQCNIVGNDQRIFYGELAPLENDIQLNKQQFKIEWHDFDQSSHALDPVTLAPIEPIILDDEQIDNKSIMEATLNAMVMKELQSLREEQDKISEESFDSENDLNSAQKSVSSLEMKKNEKMSIKSNTGLSVIERKSMLQKIIENRKDSFQENNFNEKLLEQQIASIGNLNAENKIDIKDDYEIKGTSSSEHKNNQEEQFIQELPHWFYEQGNFALAVSGKVFEQLIDDMENNSYPLAKEVFKKMLERAQIFARMKPEEKANLIQYLQTFRNEKDILENNQTLVGMCGDGANDCAALKTADIGVSLSEAEASIAAPFTSKIQNISCIVKLLREGRCALTTSFQCFKYMALYSTIQFIAVTLLYSALTDLSNMQFLQSDLITIFPLAVFMGYTKSYKKLTQYRPSSSLLSAQILVSVIGQTIINDAFQIGAFVLLHYQPWFLNCQTLHKNNFQDGDTADCYENTVYFLFSLNKFAQKRHYLIFQIFNICLQLLLFLLESHLDSHSILIYGLQQHLQYQIYQDVIYYSYQTNGQYIFIMQIYQSKFINILFYQLYYIQVDWRLILFGFVIINFVLVWLYEKFCVKKIASLFQKKSSKINELKFDSEIEASFSE